MKLKYRLKNNEFVIGTWCDIPSAATANILAKSGLDFIIIDMEHGPMDFKVAQDMIFAAEADGCEAIIRVASQSESDILRALDLGGSGIIVPHIETESAVRLITERSKFYPIGQRGFNPYVRAGGYNSRNNNYFEQENNNQLVAIILEGVNAIHNLDIIVSHEHIDVVYIGAYDLSVSLGIPGEVKHEKVLSLMKSSVEKICSRGKSAGLMIHNLDEFRFFKNIGAQFFVFKVDTSVLFDAYEKTVKELRND